MIEDGGLAGLLRAARACGARALLEQATSLAITCAQRDDVPTSGGDRRRGHRGRRWRRHAGQPSRRRAIPGPGGILFAASGEVLALTGYPFPPANAGDPAFVDGWDVHFTRLLVTVDNITLSNGPNVTPGDQSCTEPTVAKVDGPWAVDLAHSDPSYLPGKGGAGEEAVPIAALSNQNYPAGNTRGVRHQRRDAVRVRLRHRPGDHERDERQPRRRRPGRLRADDRRRVRGPLRRHRDVQGHELHLPDRRPSDAACDPGIYGPGKWPPGRRQRCPSTSASSRRPRYVNCQNPDNDPATAARRRGARARDLLQERPARSSGRSRSTPTTRSGTACCTIRRRTSISSRRASPGMGRRRAPASPYPTVTLEMTKGVDYTAYTDASGTR